ncbi:MULTISPECIES: Rha family transcriptional regulator [unclassified Cedecea]|uniref:Rha family transcriptional regulator n=1 Tax=unclassified Cedecea TaxID=2649846 RepID=UPI003019D588
MASQFPCGITPEVIVRSGRPVTTTKSVAAFFAKQHQHVTQKVESLDCSEQFLTSNFSLVTYEHNGNTYKMYEMTKNGFVFLVMGFTGKKAAEFKEAYIAEFDKMESELLSLRVGENTLGDLVNTKPTSLSVRDGRRSKKETDRKAAERIAEKCVPVILREMRDYQYHYSNCEIGPDEVLTALLSEEREGLQLHALIRELGNNNHEVSGAYRELEVIRYCLMQQRKAIGDMLTHAEYIIKQAKSH